MIFYYPIFTRNGFILRYNHTMKISNTLEPHMLESQIKSSRGWQLWSGGRGRDVNGSRKFPYRPTSYTVHTGRTPF
jgi:hypothetical protein